MKKTVIVLMIMIFVLMANMTAVQAATTYGVKMTPSETSVKQGETVEVTINLNNINVEADRKGITGFEAKIQYDTSVFESLVRKDIEELDDNWDKPEFNPNNGKLITSSSTYYTQNIDILKIKFKVKDNAKLGQTTITVSDISSADFKGPCKSNDVVTCQIEIKDKNEVVEDKTAPTGTVSYSKGTDNVTVTIAASEPVKALSGWSLSSDQKTLTKVFTDNYTGTVVLEDLAGNRSQALQVKVDSLADKTAPTGSVNYTKGTNAVTVTITSSEPLKELSGWVLSADKKTLTKVYTANYTGTVVIEDLAGNKSQAIAIKVDSLSASTADTVPPTGSVRYSKGANGVTVTITSSEQIKPVTGWTLSTDKKSISRVFTANYTGTVIIEDLAGNKSKEIQVKVDTSLPNGGVSDNTSNTSNSPIKTTETSANEKLPKAGSEMILPIIVAVAAIGGFAFFKYRGMKY